jgi:hypothetical protein
MITSTTASVMRRKEMEVIEKKRRVSRIAASVVRVRAEAVRKHSARSSSPWENISQ